MSILLDALKKSEEQRQLGSTPNIHSAVADQSIRTGGELQWLPLSMMAFSAIVIAWLGWNQYEKPEPDNISEPPGVTAETTEAAAGSRVSGNDEAIRAAAKSGVESLTDQRTPVESIAGNDKARPGIAVLPPRQSDSTDEQRERLKQSVSNYQAEETDTPGQDETLVSTIPPQSPAPTVAGEEGVAEPAQPHVPEPISFWELPQGVRDDLPEIKISVLVFAEKPSDRFLLVNGMRMVEKDSLGGGVELDEIRREGAVFLYRKYRFLIKG